MNVLSLFDGMSCGRIALERAGIEVDNYYSSEIDKYAIQIADKNYPQDTKNRLGNICNINSEDLPKIDLLIGGSPCQGFSFAGKQLNFEDERSKLFFEFVRLLKECKPKYFLLENVEMKKEYQKVITNILDCEPIEIDSALVSGGLRKRLYWTNIDFEIIDDKNISITDIMEDIECDKIDDFKPSVKKNIAREYDNIIKSDKVLYTCECTSGWQDNKVGLKKAPTLRAGNSFTLCMDSKNRIRKLTVNEWEKLQTVPINYTEGVSNTQRYKMLGNGWTVDVISHILKGLKGV